MELKTPIHLQVNKNTKIYRAVAKNGAAGSGIPPILAYLCPSRKMICIKQVVLSGIREEISRCIFIRA